MDGNVRCSGWFDEENKELVVAINRPDWIEILAHEYSHLTQWVEQIKVWKQAEKEWIAGITYNFNRFAFIQEFEDVCLKLDPKNPENCFKAIRDNIPLQNSLR